VGDRCLTSIDFKNFKKKSRRRKIEKQRKIFIKSFTNLVYLHKKSSFDQSSFSLQGY
jgi:hypothetical protein